MSAEIDELRRRLRETEDRDDLQDEYNEAVGKVAWPAIDSIQKRIEAAKTIDEVAAIIDGFEMDHVDGSHSVLSKDHVEICVFGPYRATTIEHRDPHTTQQFEVVVEDWHLGNLLLNLVVLQDMVAKGEA